MYKKEKEVVLEELNSSLHGLKEYEVKRRLKAHGKNIIKREKRLKPLKIFLLQFKDPLVIILIFATIISFLLGENLDGYVILAILLLNAGFGFFQEYKAEKSIELLRKLSAPHARVIRDGVTQTILAKNLVPGDILILEEGDKITADARILESISLQVDESTLTGESIAVNKHVKTLKNSIPLAERTNMIYSGTMITKGHGKAVVVDTGMRTELGKIASLVQTVEEVKTPLQQRLKKLGINLAIITLIACFGILGIGLLRGMEFFDIFFSALALAVSVIPEGLPAVVTISLALGVQRMFKRKSLIRKLQAVETLGSTTIICADKTGTITKNEMTVKEIFMDNQTINVSGEGYKTKGDFYLKDKKFDKKKLKLLLDIGASCNNASLPNIGDPTELALLVVGKKGNVNGLKDRISELAFSSERKYMITEHSDVKYMKGAAEIVLRKCSRIYVNGRASQLNEHRRKIILAKNKEMASRALRVLGFAYKKNKDWVYVGLMAMHDPPRKEVKDAIELSKKAGIRTIMITGDHKDTAVAIAKQIGISGGVLEGKQLDKVRDLKEIVEKVNIYARVDPKHKVRILEALQKKGEVVAMTGDGVNDAPALKKADVGVAMSIKGTDVARDASDMVLVDDNYASIVSAVKEGRVIYDNIKKFVKFLLSSNVDEILVIVFALIVGWQLPFLPLQILWLNLVSDSFPALALGVDTPAKNVMSRKPRDRKEHILSNTWGFILTSGVIAATGSLITFFVYMSNIEKARTMALTVAIVFELFLVFTCRSNKYNAWEIGRNKWLWFGVLTALGLHLIVLYTSLSNLFHFVGLGLKDWLIVVGFACLGFVFFEIKKFIFKR